MDNMSNDECFCTIIYGTIPTGQSSVLPSMNTLAEITSDFVRFRFSVALFSWCRKRKKPRELRWTEII